MTAGRPRVRMATQRERGNADVGGGAPPANGCVELADVTRWHTHLHASSTPMMLADGDRRQVEVNAAACNLLGRNREQILGVRIDDLVAADARATMDADWDRFISIGWMIGDLQFLDPVGRRVEAEFAAIAHVLRGVHLVLFHSWRACPCAASTPSDDRLTEPERRVLSLIAMGRDTGEIAQRLNVSREVVQGDLDRAMARMNARNQSHLVAIAVRRGLIEGA